ncbi:MAG: prolipoprotein diacylglyceryl transferase [Longimicrobiales bacterium]
MYPILFEIGGFPITSFGVMMFLAFIAAAWTLSVQLGRRGLEREFAWDVLGWVALGGILGAKLYYLGLHWEDVLANPLGELTSRAGLVWYGGFIGGAAAYLWQIRRHGMPLAGTFDAIAPGLALAQGIGRIGCFLVGDDYGLPTDSAVGVAFPEGTPPSTAGYLRQAGAEIPADIPDTQVLAVHPTQLYEAAAAFVICGVLWRLSRRRLAAGRLFALYLMLAGTARFFIEIVRAKTDRFVFGLSTSQIVSLAIVLAGAVIWARSRSRTPAPADADATAVGA